jgi:hypothetical protein
MCNSRRTISTNYRGGASQRYGIKTPAFTSTFAQTFHTQKI